MVLRGGGVYQEVVRSSILFLPPYFHFRGFDLQASVVLWVVEVWGEELVMPWEKDGGRGALPAWCGVGRDRQDRAFRRGWTLCSWWAPAQVNEVGTTESATLSSVRWNGREARTFWMEMQI